MLPYITWPSVSAQAGSSLLAVRAAGTSVESGVTTSVGTKVGGRIGVTVGRGVGVSVGDSNAAGEGVGAILTMTPSPVVAALATSGGYSASGGKASSAQ